MLVNIDMGCYGIHMKGNSCLLIGLPPAKYGTDYQNRKSCF